MTNILKIALIHLLLFPVYNSFADINLFNGKDLKGWEGIGGEASKNWEVKNGTYRALAGPALNGLQPMMNFRILI